MDNVIIKRIIHPPACDGVYCTDQAFKGLPLEVRELLVTQIAFESDAEEDKRPAFSTSGVLASSLLMHILMRYPKQLGYTATAALARALKEIDGGKVHPETVHEKASAG